MMDFRKATLVIAVFAFASFNDEASASPFVLDITSPSQSTTPNDWDENQATHTGTVGTTSLSINSTNTPWRSTYNADAPLYGRTDLFGALAFTGSVAGDFFSMSFGGGQTDTITVTLSGPLMDPIFFIGDMDIVGSTLTIPAGWSSRTNNADSSYSGNVLTTNSGAVSNPPTPGAWTAIQYSGLFGPGSTFQFIFDFSNASFSNDNVAFGIGVLNLAPTTPPSTNDLPAPVPLAFVLFGLMGIGFVKRRRCT